MAKIKINIKDGTISKNKKVLGIDLGTTNSLVALVNETNQTPYCISNNDGKLTPSVVYVDSEHQYIVGQKAIDFLKYQPKNTINSIKRMMGKSYTDVKNSKIKHSVELIEDESNALVKFKIHERIYNPIQISSIILKSLKEKAEQLINETIQNAVITVPAYFNDAQRQATKDAGKLAGLDVLRIINEPTAASLAYGLGLKKEEEKTVAVYDLGGGTFDVSILRIQNGVFEVLSTNGNTELGGDDFDQEIVSFWLNQYQIDHVLENYQLLRLTAEKAKIQLSQTDVFEEQLVINQQTYTLKINLTEFNQLIDKIISKTIESCKKAIKDSELELSEIEEVVMVGGSTRVPLVYQKVKAFFQFSKINNSINPDEVVALGAAIEADILAGNRKDVFLLDVTPLSLGIETVGGLMDVIIPRNSKAPNRAGRQYTTSIDGQSKLKISVFQGERELVKDNRHLGEFVLNNIPAMPAGLPKIDIQFFIDADGILKVEATELRSGVKQDVEIKPQYGLTDQQVEQMLMDAMKNAEIDLKNRQLAETKTEAEQLIYQCKKLIDTNKTLLTESELNVTNLHIQKLELVCKENDEDTIKKEIERLNTLTRPFAERLMDYAIGNALKGKKI